MGCRIIGLFGIFSPSFNINEAFKCLKESGEESNWNIFWIWKESINIIFLFKFIRSLTRRKDNCIQDVIVRIRVKNKHVKKFWKNCISSVRMFNSRIFHNLVYFFLRSRTSVSLKDFCKKKRKRGHRRAGFHWFYRVGKVRESGPRYKLDFPP